MKLPPGIYGGIIVKTSFWALHFWEDAPLAQNYLQFPHRHVFHVEASFDITHTKRQIEFIAMKEAVTKYCRDEFEGKEFGLSCEDIALRIMERFDASIVDVLEDGENGAYLVRSRKSNE